MRTFISVINSIITTIIIVIVVVIVSQNKKGSISLMIIPYLFISFLISSHYTNLSLTKALAIINIHPYFADLHCLLYLFSEKFDQGRGNHYYHMSKMLIMMVPSPYYESLSTDSML